MNWDDKRAGVNFLYAMAANSTVHWERTKTFCDWMLPGGGAEYTPRGLLFLNEWGTLGTIQNKNVNFGTTGIIEDRTLSTLISSASLF